MILMASNYYIRKSSIISRRGDKWNPRHRTRSSDPAMQFEFMTREELKEMVLRERERKARTAESERISSESEQHEKPAHVETAGIEPQESEPRQVMAGAPETDAKAPVSEETVLMANLLMEDDESEKEPLPPESELWEMPNVTVTPHISAGSELSRNRLTDLFCENLKRYLAGQPLLNVIEKGKGY